MSNGAAQDVPSQWMSFTPREDDSVRAFPEWEEPEPESRCSAHAGERACARFIRRGELAERWSGGAEVIGAEDLRSTRRPPGHAVSTNLV